jgi:NAD(P)-dependent dehydrogenase (short-subunit alcohol dehydrogenase family)
VPVKIDLSGRNAIVTGAGAGIGAEIARWLARAGATVVVHDIRAEMAKSVADSILAEGGYSFPVIADALDDAALESMIDESVRLLGGRLDIAVNNVGMYGEHSPGPFTALDGDHWRGLLDRNLVVTALAGAAEARRMIVGGGGVILNVSSGEINHLTTTMAVELGPHGIRVNAIAPGTTLTETVRDSFDDEHVQALVEATPLRRATEFDELGRLSVFLVSDLARCVTGQLILADAGAFLSRTRPSNRTPGA